MTDLWDEVLKVAEQQRAKGKSKYGEPVTADTAVDWCQHAIEEQLDSAVYTKAIKQVIEDLKQELELVSDQRDRIAAAADAFEEQLKATAADLRKLVEEKQELLTECRRWEQAATQVEDEVHQMDEALADCRRKLEKAAIDRDAALEARDLDGAAYADVIAQRDAEIADFKKASEQLLKLWDKEEKEWEAVTDRRINEVEQEKQRMSKKVALYEDMWWAPVLVGFCIGAAVVAVFRFAP